MIWFSYRQRIAPEGLRGSIYPNDVLERACPARATAEVVRQLDPQVPTTGDR